jgi:ATP-dependent DNA helicase RecG
MKRVNLTDGEYTKLLLRTEGHFLDFKAKEIQPAKLLRAVSAFANADGGELFIGIAEHTPGGAKTWSGLDREEAANGFIQAIELMLPLGQHNRMEFLEKPGQPGLVLHVEILKTREIISTPGGEIYVRRGAQCLPVTTPDQKVRLELNKGIHSFETSTLAVAEQTVTASVVTSRFMKEVIPHQEAAKWLRKQMLIVDEKPTVAGLVLFSDEPQAMLPKRCGIKLYRYRTVEEGTREALDGQPATIEGCLYDQVYEAVARTKQIIEGIRRMTPEGLVTVEYPQETLHEIITNALIHRDYSIPDDVHIRIYDNRVEIENPGTLPGHITVANILAERFARNGNIVRVINKFPNPPNKDVGEGLNTAFRAMKLLQLKEPVIQQKDNSVLVVIRHEKLASPEGRIMKYLEDHDTIDNGEARDICVIRACLKSQLFSQTA